MKDGAKYGNASCSETGRHLDTTYYCQRFNKCFLAKFKLLKLFGNLFGGFLN